MQLIAQQADQILRDTGLLEVGVTETNPFPALHARQQMFRYPDISIVVTTRDGVEYKLVFEVMRQVQPKHLRLIAAQFALLMQQNPNWYGIVAGSYLSRESLRFCRDNGMGCMDAAGNCFLSFDGVSINVEGRPNPYKEKRPLKSLFSPKATRVLRVLLSEPERNWKVQELAASANVSTGLVSNVKRKLEDNEFVVLISHGGKAGFRLANPEALLRKWAADYKYTRNTITNFYSMESTKRIEDQIAQYCRAKDTNYAFTLTSGAELVAPFLRYQRVFAYLDGDTDEIAQSLDWQQVSSGPNVSILKPYDDYVLYGVREIEDKRVVSDIQLYLDLYNFRQGGREAAEHLLAMRLEEAW